MSKFNKKTSQETIKESMKMAKANQRPGQTKEQTKLIAQGIQKGIEQYKKQQKFKARELDKRLKATKNNQNTDIQISLQERLQSKEKQSIQILPWSLLLISWIVFIFYIFYF